MLCQYCMYDCVWNGLCLYSWFLSQYCLPIRFIQIPTFRSLKIHHLYVCYVFISHALQTPHSKTSSTKSGRKKLVKKTSTSTKKENEFKKKKTLSGNMLIFIYKHVLSKNVFTVHNKYISHFVVKHVDIL